MTVVVSFIRVGPQYSASGINNVRIRENLTVGGTTTATAEDGEMVLIGNAETSMIAAAFGTTPDAATASRTGASSAGMPIPAGGQSYPIFPAAGDKINVKTVT